MIKVQFDFSHATPEEMADFYGFPGVHELLDAISKRGAERNVKFEIPGAGAAVDGLMAAGVEFAEYRKLCAYVAASRPDQPSYDL